MREDKTIIAYDEGYQAGFDAARFENDDIIKAFVVEIARLRKALEPFAHLEPEYTDDDGNGEFIIHRDDLRAARAAMGEKE